MGNNQAGSGKGQRVSRGGRRDGHLNQFRVRRAKSDVGSRRNLKVTKLSTQQTLCQRNLRNKDDVIRQLKTDAKARKIEACDTSIEYFEDEDGVRRKCRLQSSGSENGHGIQYLESSTSAENCPVSPEEEENDDVHYQKYGKLNRHKECVTGLDDIKEMLTSLQKKFDEIPKIKTITRLRKSSKLRRSKSDVNVSYSRGNVESVGPNDDYKPPQYKKQRPSERRSPHVVQRDLRTRMIEDEMDALPRSPVADHVKSRRKRRVPRTSQSRSSKLRRSVSDVDISYRGQKSEQRSDVQISSTLRRSMSDVDVSNRGNKKGRTSPQPRPTRRHVPIDKDPEDTTRKDGPDAVRKKDQHKHHNQRHDYRRRPVGTPSNLRRSMSDVDVSYHDTDRETSPTHHKHLLYNAPPVEFAEDSSEENTSNENLVILGSFKAGEDTGRKGRDGRKPAEPVGAGAKVVTGLVDSVKQSLRIPEEDVKEGETTYGDQLPHLIQGWATRQYTDSKKDEDSGFMDNLMGRFNGFFGDESKGREPREHVILGGWAGGEDTGRQQTDNDSGLIHNLKQAFLGSTGRGGTGESPGFLGTLAGGEDSGRSHADEPGPFSFLGSLRRSFRTSSGEDAPYGGESEPVSPVFTGTFMGGEDGGRNRKSGTSTSPSFMDYLPSFASTSESSDKGRNDHSWFSPEQWWTGGKDQEANDSPSWFQNLQNTMQSPWGEDKKDENADKARSVLDQWTGRDKARSMFDRWKNKTQNNSNSNQKREKGNRGEEKGSLMDYLGLNQLFDGQTSQGRHPCGGRGHSPRPREKNSPFSFFS